MAFNKGKQSRKAEQIPKRRPSSDRGLQPAHVKSELLVIADQHAAVNTFPGLVHTARHTMRVGNILSKETSQSHKFCVISQVRPSLLALFNFEGTSYSQLHLEN